MKIAKKHILCLAESVERKINTEHDVFDDAIKSQPVWHEVHFLKKWQNKQTLVKKLFGIRFLFILHFCSFSQKWVFECIPIVKSHSVL